MYRCYCCGVTFYETQKKEREDDYVPAPFGIGTVRLRGGCYDCCPECEGEDYAKMYFDGVHCPYCGEVIKLKDIVDDDNCEFKCESCNTGFYIVNGEVEDAYRK